MQECYIAVKIAHHAVISSFFNKLNQNIQQTLNESLIFITNIKWKTNVFLIFVQRKCDWPHPLDMNIRVQFKHSVTENFHPNTKWYIFPGNAFYHKLFCCRVPLCILDDKKNSNECLVSFRTSTTSLSFFFTYSLGLLFFCLNFSSESTWCFRHSIFIVIILCRHQLFLLLLFLL